MGAFLEVVVVAADNDFVDVEGVYEVYGLIGVVADIAESLVDQRMKLNELEFSVEDVGGI